MVHDIKGLRMVFSVLVEKLEIIQTPFIFLEIRMTRE